MTRIKDKSKYNFMIFKADDNSKEDNEKYESRIADFAEQIVSGHLMGKKVLIITGSGISASVPSMQDLMDKIVNLVEEYDGPWEKSSVFEGIFSNYCKCKENESEKHQMQSRLLTYIQNAYMEKKKYVQDEDLIPLSNVWNSFVVWLLQGDEDYSGIINAQPSKNHQTIRDMYKCMNAISITTNFDNLLEKAFVEKENFYPILDNEAFDRYYLSKEDDHSFIEIQSRGDVFWLECTGTKSKICPNRHRQCFVPGKAVKNNNGKIVCNLCGSDAKIYFAFPGTKEKDEEMSLVINGIWKYLANTISSVIVIGNSMDYDPVLIEFLRELIQKRKTPVMYISRYKKNAEGKGLRDYKELYKKEATKFLFSDYVNTKNIWARAENTEKILRDLISVFKRQKEAALSKVEFILDDKEKTIAYFKDQVLKLFGDKSMFDEVERNLEQGINICRQALNLDKVKQMRHFSQLGLKTYWLRGHDNAYQEHNRLKHSLGVMLIASYLYLKVSTKPNRNELFFLQVAALFHDLGHLPFSHLLEEVFDEFGWIPVGESKSFNHEQHTKRMIEKLEKESAGLKQILEDIGYSAIELQQLINGEFGKGYLDAFINSPIDCDKIEYLFSDAVFMNRGTPDDFKLFIENYADHLSINQNNFLLIEKNSTKSFLQLIRMRGEMYDQVYLRSGLRYLESCCKLIIRTFISYVCTQEAVFIAVKDKEKFNEYYNLSDSKIEQVIAFIEECLEGIPPNEVCEICVLEKMVKEIEQNVVISDLMKTTIKNCMKLVKNTHGNIDVAKIEEERILTFEITNKGFNRSMIKQLLKDVYLRFPGVILIDFVESKSSFSFGKRESRKRRSDGTKSATENVLIRDIRQIKGRTNTEFKCLGDVTNEVNQELHYSNHRYINLYRISENLFYYMQAEDYIVHELKKEGIIGEN